MTEIVEGRMVIKLSDFRRIKIQAVGKAIVRKPKPEQAPKPEQPAKE